MPDRWRYHTDESGRQEWFLVWVMMAFFGLEGFFMDDFDAVATAGLLGSFLILVFI